MAIFSLLQNLLCEDGELQVVEETSQQILSLVQLQGSDLSQEAWIHVFDVIQSIYSGK